jgi:hypothetical protein
MWGFRRRAGLVISLAAVSVTALFLARPVPLGSGYHNFADTRALLGIPNCLNALSNIPFLLVGLGGLSWLLRSSSDCALLQKVEKIPYVVFFAGVTLTGLGSFWYHLAPGNSRLAYDLVPMTLSFISMLATVIIERISLKWGFFIYVPSLVLGVASVGHWYLTEVQGRGDYRFYLFVQFFPPILLALIITLFSPRYTGAGYLVGAFLVFVAAKLMETFDQRIYSTAHILSGHSLKHMTAAFACYLILKMLQTRRPAENLEDLIRDSDQPVATERCDKTVTSM